LFVSYLGSSDFNSNLLAIESALGKVKTGWPSKFMATEEKRRVRVGMVGGGPGAGIAESHRTAMRLDDRYILVAGVLSRDREKSLMGARQLRIPEDRVYVDYVAMADAESKREESRVDAVSIVTRTDSHYEIAKKFLETGINVICDKPLCLALAEA
jgi:predicted dehydrogenase